MNITFEITPETLASQLELMSNREMGELVSLLSPGTADALIQQLQRRPRLNSVKIKADGTCELNENEKSLCADGNLSANIQAVKALRIRTGSDLRPAKESVDAYLATQGWLFNSYRR